MTSGIASGLYLQATIQHVLPHNQNNDIYIREDDDETELAYFKTELETKTPRTMRLNMLILRALKHLGSNSKPEYVCVTASAQC